MFVADLAAAIHTLFLEGPLLASGSAFGPRVGEPAWLKPMESEGIGWEGKPSLFMLIIVRRGNRHVGRHCRRVTSVKPLLPNASTSSLSLSQISTILGYAVKGDCKKDSRTKKGLRALKIVRQCGLYHSTSIAKALSQQDLNAVSHVLLRYPASQSLLF